MSSHGPRVSVVVRNRNEAKYLRDVLPALAAQQLPHEIVLVDDGSTDDSVALAREAGAHVVALPAGTFTYGRALNVGIAAARGEICVILSAHSMPVGRAFLDGCVRPFDDPAVAAVRCLYAGKRADATRWLAPERLTGKQSVETVVSKGPLASGCAIRRRVWEEVPFDEQAVAAEEKLWALDVLERGHTIYSPCEAVYTYLKPLSSRDAILKNGRELAEIYRRTGQRVGFMRKGAVTGLLDIGRAAVKSAPQAAFGAVRDECLRTYVRVRSGR
jgi:glycosyltransferase involved in cell wall biosynthesis